MQRVFFKLNCSKESIRVVALLKCGRRNLSTRKQPLLPYKSFKSITAKETRPTLAGNFLFSTNNSNEDSLIIPVQLDIN
ncbi:hypothetical protein QQF64_017574 [Cirrhinus molitorella]|uniref:Uncharacterized protein n=1 Tax=Cirrhinus molitorella TaxID=172907 RepID=A0ABR3LLH9_9TELE